MKNLLIMCGSGIATSTVVTGKVKDWLKENNLEREVKTYQGKVADELNNIDNYDVVLSTTTVSDKYKDRVINAIPLLTGIDTEKVFAELKERIEEIDRKIL